MHRTSIVVAAFILFFAVGTHATFSGATTTTTGHLLWRTQINYQDTSPVTSFNSTHVLVTGSAVYLLDRQTGQATNLTQSNLTGSFTVVNPTAIDGKFVASCVYVNEEIGFTFVMIDAATAKVVWSDMYLQCDQGWPSHGLIYVEGNVVQIRDGALMWQSPTENGHPIFNADREIIYVSAPVANVITTNAMNMTTGKQLFSVKSALMAYQTQRPFVADGILVLPAANAFNATTGTWLWQASNGDHRLVGFGYTAIPNSDRKVVVFGTRKTIAGYDLHNGRHLWGFNSSSVFTFNPTVNADGFLFAIVDSQFTCFDALTGKMVWVASFENGVLLADNDAPSPTVYNGVVYVAASGFGAAQFLVAVDLQTGHQLDGWSFDGAFDGDQFFADAGVLYTGDDSGSVTAVKLVK